MILRWYNISSDIECGELFQKTLEQLDRQQREMVKQVKMDIEEMEHGRQRLVEQFEKVCVV